MGLLEVQMHRQSLEFLLQLGGLQQGEQLPLQLRTGQRETRAEIAFAFARNELLHDWQQDSNEGARQVVPVSIVGHTLLLEEALEVGFEHVDSPKLEAEFEGGYEFEEVLFGTTLAELELGMEGVSAGEPHKLDALQGLQELANDGDA